MKRRFVALLIFVLTFCSLSIPVSAASKVTLTPAGNSLIEGQSTAVQVNLDEPIIGPGPGPAYLHINLTSSDPSRVAIDPNPVEYTQVEWSQAKIFTVTALLDNKHNTGDSVTVSFTIDSDSEFYDGFSGNFVLSITDVDPAPVINTVAPSSTTTVAPAPTLASTGQNIQWANTLSFAILGISTVLLLGIIRRS